ncbi:MAG TPA: hypothetical protein VNE62_04825 [Actinomycetota bacterium]|nr:hypothetical protein [Actinomycetota bacterium]
MDFAMPVAWGEDSRGFWTKRKRSAVSLLTVLSLVTGVAVAYKLFTSAIPNNVVRDASTFNYEVWKRDANLRPDPDEEFINTAGCASTSQPGCTTTYGATAIYEDGIDTFPGDTRTVEVRLDNTNSMPAKDATFYVYIRDISVIGCVDGGGNPRSCSAPGSTPQVIGQPSNAANAFIAFWTFSVDKESVYHADSTELNGDDHGLARNPPNLNGDPDNRTIRDYVQSCEGGLKGFVQSAPCDLGTVKAFGSEDATGARTDQRYYEFNLTEEDNQTDQSAFKGWKLNFSLVFQARVPAVQEVAAIGAR